MSIKINSLLIKWLSKLAQSNLHLLICLSGPMICHSMELIEKTIVLVNNEPILLSDLNQLQSRLKKSGMIDDLLLLDASPNSLLKDTKAQLQFLVHEKILDSEVKRNSLAVTMDRVDLEMREIAKRNNIGKDELIKTLQSQGVNISEYQAFLKQRIERQSVVEQEVTSKIRLSDEDIMAYYMTESGKPLSKVNEYTLSHIFFSPEKHGPKDASSRAQSVFLELRDGGNFDKLLSKYTEEENPSPNGHLGTFKSGEFSGEMEKAVRDLNIGDFSEVVRSRSGFHIIKLINKKIVSDPLFEKNKEKYRGMLFEKVFKRQFRSWLDQKKDETTIIYN